MNAEAESVHVFVSGRVQGVGFRAFVRDEAKVRGLNGWVRNRNDGRVEAVLHGPAGDVDAALERIRTGPRFSSVDQVAVSTSSDPVESGFTVRPTV